MILRVIVVHLCNCSEVRVSFEMGYWRSNFMNRVLDSGVFRLVWFGFALTLCVCVYLQFKILFN